MSTQLWILESLKPHERSTGEELRQFVLNRGDSFPGRISVEMTKPWSRSQFMDVLERMFQSADEGNFPILHVEAHGGEDGLYLASGEMIEWDELSIPLIKINRRLRGNLIITVAACWGGYMARTTLSATRAPFLVVVGPETKIYDSHLIHDYSHFYYEFVGMRSLTKARWALNAFKKANQTYFVSTASHCFTELMRSRLTNSRTAEENASRIEELVAKALASDPDCDVESAREVAEAITLDTNRFLRIAWDLYVYADEYPKNKDLFPFPFEAELAPTRTL